MPPAPPAIARLVSRLPAWSGLAALLAVLVLPLLVVGVRELAHPAARAMPAADAAIIELELAQVPGHWPTTGAYSRFEFHHPGPAGTYLLLPWYLLGLRHSVAVNVGALVLNLLALAALYLLLRPTTTRAALAGVVVGLLTLRYLGSPLVTSPWGPYQCLLPLLAMLALTARFERRDRGSWLAAALLGGVLIQLHVLFVPVCALLLVVGVLVPGGRGLGLGRGWLWTLGGLALLCWLPVLADLARGSESNAMDLVRFFRKPYLLEEPSLRFLLGAQAVAALPLALAGAMASPFPGRAHAAWAPADPAAVWLALLAQIILGSWIVVGLCRRRDGSPACRLVLAALVVLVWGLFSVLRIRGPVFPYILAWLTPATALLWAVGLWRGLGSVWRWHPARSLAVVAGLAVAGWALASFLAGDRANRAELPLAKGRTAAALADRILAAEPGLCDTGVHIARADRELWSILSGLLLQLRKAGVEATVCHDFGLMIPPAYLDVLPDRPALLLTREDPDAAELPLVDEVDGVQVRRVGADSEYASLAFGPGWDPPASWGRMLRAREGQLVALAPGAATLRLEVSNAKEMVDGQVLTVVENGREMWSGEVTIQPWHWTALEIPLGAVPGNGRRDIRFVCERVYPIGDARVRPVALPVRKVRIVRSSP